jgi:hypothetical protein
MASFIRRGKTRRVQVSCYGTRDSATFDTKAQAVAWAADRESEIRAGATGKIIPQPVRKALSRYADEVSQGKYEKGRLESAESVRFGHGLGHNDAMALKGGSSTHQSVSVAVTPSADTQRLGGEFTMPRADWRCGARPFLSLRRIFSATSMGFVVVR